MGATPPSILSILIILRYDMIIFNVVLGSLRAVSRRDLKQILLGNG